MTSSLFMQKFLVPGIKNQKEEWMWAFLGHFMPTVDLKQGLSTRPPWSSLNFDGIGAKGTVWLSFQTWNSSNYRIHLNSYSAHKDLKL